MDTNKPKGAAEALDVRNSSARLRDLKRRLANARKRAAFWSGRPNFSGRGFVGSSGHGDDEYSLAMCDIRRLCDALEGETGKRPKQSDPKREFSAGFSQLMNAITKPSPNTKIRGGEQQAPHSP